MNRNYLILIFLFIVGCKGNSNDIEEENSVGTENEFMDTTSNKADTTSLPKTQLLSDSVDGRPNNMVLQKENGLRIEWEVKSGNTRLTQKDVSLINYSARVAGGETYDSNMGVGKPVPVKAGIGILVQGMEEGLLEMAPGDKGRIMIPNALGYGEDGYGTIVPPKADLIFDVEIVKRLEPIKLEDGVEVFKWHKVDTSRTPKKNDKVTFEYFAYSQGENGKMYDNSFQNGEPFTMKFKNDNVMDGLHIGMSVLKAGENAFIHIPAKVAYGSKGLVDKVSPNTDIMYDVRILSIE